MTGLLRFIIVAIVSGSVVAGGSLLWPKFTNRPQPQQLLDVRQAVLGTSIGQQVALQLGITDKKEEPVNIASVAGNTVNTVIQQIQQTAQDTITREVIIQIVQKIESLNPNDQSFIKNAICK